MKQPIDSYLLSQHQDRRRKLTDYQKDTILMRYKQEDGVTIRDLATEYGVSYKTILKIVNPESREKAAHYNKMNWWKFRADTETRSMQKQEQREYKLKLLENGELGQ